MWCIYFGVGFWHRYLLFCVSIFFFLNPQQRAIPWTSIHFTWLHQLLAFCHTVPHADIDSSPLHTSAPASSAKEVIPLYNHILSTLGSSSPFNIHSTPRFPHLYLVWIQGPVQFLPLPVAVMSLWSAPSWNCSCVPLHSVTLTVPRNPGLPPGMSASWVTLLPLAASYRVHHVHPPTTGDE